MKRQADPSAGFKPRNDAYVRIFETGRPHTVWLKVGLLTLQFIATLQVANSQQQMSVCSAARPYIARAQKALAVQDSNTAVNRLFEAIKADPKCADAYLLLGLTEFHSGHTADSITHYKQSLQLEPRSYSAHYDLALAYLKQDNIAGARTELERAVVLNPKQANAAYDLGVVLLQLQQPAAALPHLLRARALDPDRADVAFNVVRAQIEAGEITEARKTAQDGGRQFKSDFQWNVAIGRLFLRHAQPSEATVYLRAGNLIHPEAEDVRDQLATAYLSARKPENVLDLINDPKTADDHFLRGSAFYQAHRFTDADVESDAALTLAPENPKILILRVRLLQRAGHQNAALELTKKASNLAPDWDQPYYLAGISYYFLRHYADARKSLERAFQLNQSSAAAVFVEGLAWAGEGNPKEAERCLRQAMALQPENARFHCHLGILLMRANQNREAEDSFDKAIALKPEYALSHYELGKLRLQSKQWKQAGDELEKAVTLDPGFTSAYYQLGIVYARLGEKEKSEHMLDEFKRLHQKEADESAAVDADARDEASDSQ